MQLAVLSSLVAVDPKLKVADLGHGSDMRHGSDLLHGSNLWHGSDIGHSSDLVQGSVCIPRSSTGALSEKSIWHTGS
jgi:hypothetical protein